LPLLKLFQTRRDVWTSLSARSGICSA
jgi:hypothetical protein